MNRKLLYILLCVLALISVGIIIIGITSIFSKPSKIITKPDDIVAGQTTEREIQDLPNTIKDSIDSDTTRYTFNPEKNIRTDTAVVKDNSVVFKSTRVDPSTHKTIPEYIKEYGQPEKTFNFSVYYGENASTYVFLSYGLAIIGNPNTGEVYEIQEFTPTTLDQYLKYEGNDALTKEGGNHGE